MDHTIKIALLFSVTYIICLHGSDVGVVDESPLQRIPNFYFPQSHSRDDLQTVTENTQDIVHSIQLGTNRPTYHPQGTCTFDYQGNPCMHNQIMNQTLRDDDIDSLASIELAEPYPCVMTTDSESQTEPVIKDTRHVGVQVNIPIKAKTVTKTVYKEKKLSLSELLTKLCCCEW